MGIGSRVARIGSAAQTDLAVGYGLPGAGGHARAIPRTPRHRPLPGPLREQGLPAATTARPARQRSGGSYRRLTKAARDRLLG